MNHFFRLIKSYSCKSIVHRFLSGWITCAEHPNIDDRRNSFRCIYRKSSCSTTQLTFLNLLMINDDVFSRGGATCKVLLCTTRKSGFFLDTYLRTIQALFDDCLSLVFIFYPIPIVTNAHFFRSHLRVKES